MKSYYSSLFRSFVFPAPLCRLLLALPFILVFSESRGQVYYNKLPGFLKANSVWAFGDRAGLNFNSGAPVAMQSATGSFEAFASAASPVTGQLLFYADGMACYNVNNQVMPNGNISNNLYGVNSSTQGRCIVPMIDSPGKYYVFTLGAEGVALPSLAYSIVDMNLDFGLGDIVPGQKDIPLNSSTRLSESMIAIPGDNCDIWLMVHAFENPQFLTYHITRDGLNTVPVVSTAGTAIQGTDAYTIGGAAVSPHRQLVAIASRDALGATTPAPGIWGTVLVKFDPATGIASDGIKVIGDTFMCYSVCFSPDNSKLYVAGSTTTGAPAIYQFDVSVFNAAAIVNSRTLIAASPLWATGSIGPWQPYLRLYNDTIYAGTTHNTPSLDRINQPNLTGPACAFQANALSLLPGTTFSFSLPNDIVYPMPPDTVTSVLLDTAICAFNTGVVLNALPGYYGYQWDDGSTGTSRTITTTGSYWVLCKDSCHSRIDTFIVKPGTINFSLGNDTFFCHPDAALILEPGVPGAAAYVWQNGSQGSSYTAKSPGSYWVTVTDINGCKGADTIHIANASLEQDLGEDRILCKEAPVYVVLKADAVPGSSILWSTGSQDASIVAQDTGYYWVSVSLPPCYGTDTIRITSEVCECFSFIPSAFTPNADGINDVLQPKIDPECGISNFTFSIYNRYGQRTFVSAEAGKGWDGTFKGAPAEAGVYFFDLRFSGGRDNTNYYKKGDITLLR